MNEFSVKQLADFAKVSVRTLHYYDEIGLLKPSFIAQNNYRFYRDNEALRLQQILIYREMGFPLNKIKEILNAPNFDMRAALLSQQAQINESIERNKMLLLVISKSLSRFEMEKKMDRSELYNWHSDAKRADYIEWLNEKYDAKYNDAILHSQKAISKLSDQEREKLMQQLEEFETDLVGAYNSKIAANSPALTPILDAHRNWVSFMWDRPCPKPAYAGLADMYLSHEDFINRYETLAIGFCEYLTSAMKAYAAN